MAKSRTSKVLTLSMGQALSAIAGILVLSLLSRILSKHDYAVYRQTFLAYNFAKPILMLGLPTAIFYFMPSEKLRQRSLLYENLLLLFLMATVFAAFILLGGNKLLAWRFNNPDIIEPLRWIALYAFFMLPAAAISACLTVKERIVTLALYTMLSQFLTLGAIVCASLIWKTPEAAIIARSATGVINGIAALVLMHSAVPQEPWTLKFSSILGMVKYAVPLGLATMLVTLTKQLDKIIVSSMCSPEDFAIYINGAFEIPLIGIVSGSIAMVILADMRKMIVEGNKQEAHKLFSLSAVKAGSILLPAMVFLFLFAGPVILLLFSDTYIQSIIPFRFYLLILPVRIVFYGPALLALGKTKFILYRSLLGLIVNLVLSILLVKVFGYIGAVYATIFTLYCCNIAFSIMEISKDFECRFYEILPFVKLFKIFAWSLVPGVLIFWVYNTFLTKIPILIILPIIFIIYCLLVAGALYHMGALDVKEIKKLFTKNESKSSE